MSPVALAQNIFKRCIEEMVSMIERLIDTDHAYRAENGDVYYAVTRFPDYGKLSKKKLDELLDGASVNTSLAH